MIFTKLKGGLGNQLFQLSAALYLRTKLDALVTLQHVPGGNARQQSIMDYVVNQPVNGILKAPMNPLDKYLHLKLMDRSAFFLPARHPFATVIRRSDQLLHANYLRHKTYVLNGYFQNNNLVDSKKIESLLGIDDQEEHLLTNRNGSRIDSESLVVHIRGTDFLKSSQPERLVDSNYYLRAIEWFTDSDSFRRIIVYTDDVKYAREMTASWTFPVNIVGPQKEFHAFEVLKQISRAKRLIIGKSTFGWWAATLGSTKKVVAPSSFSVDGSSDLMPNGNWHIVDAQWKKSC